MVRMYFMCFALAFCLDKIYSTSFELLSSSGLSVIRGVINKSGIESKYAAKAQKLAIILKIK
jgi:hypothetical protein